MGEIVVENFVGMPASVLFVVLVSCVAATSIGLMALNTALRVKVEVPGRMWRRKSTGLRPCMAMCPECFATSFGFLGS